jgi:hypothetical protein
MKNRINALPKDKEWGDALRNAWNVLL